ncbi:MAG TPA: hypothetical protein VHB77_00480 [Planctomycetaceae bacterium]|nr:hypothetical protein [Planctomycetaceae bacterium]
MIVRGLIGICLALLATPLLAADLDYGTSAPDLKVVRLDSSPDDSFLSVRTDSSGRIFVGGRKTLFAYDLDDRGGYQPRKLLCEFPDHTWVYDIEVRGDDLYIVTVSAVYRIPDARVKRTGLKPERILWGVPNGHVHQCFHACAWGPEGDLYVSHGDPLWYYGDFSRPDHWGHWTLFFKPDADHPAAPGDPKADPAAGWAKMPYNGVGAVFRIRPDGTNLRSYARGLRNSCGLCFDKNWNLFTNDNDHEGLPSLYTPGRLLHVTEGSYFSWPAGWAPSKTPDRADLLPLVNEEMGRAVPVLQTYYADGFLPDRYANSLLVARWGRRTVACYPLEPTGSTFTAKESLMLEGSGNARPVGVCVGRGGRVFVTLCYMEQNEGSPTYRSDLAVITRRDDPDSMPFEAIDLTKASPEQLQAEAKSKAWSGRLNAHQEQLRRGLIAKHIDNVASPFARSLAAAIQRYSQTERVLPEKIDPVETNDRHIRQAYAFFIGSQLSPLELSQKFAKGNSAQRMMLVLAAGFRLTVPPLDAELANVPLAPQQKEEANIIQFADADQPIDLRKLGRVGNYTIAELWKAQAHTPEQEQLFAILTDRLDDQDDRVRLQAAHFLSLLNDARSEPRVAKVLTDVQDKRLNLAGLGHVKPLWMLGPLPNPQGLKTPLPPEAGAIDLGSKIKLDGKEYAWKLTPPSSPDRPLYDFEKLLGRAPNSSVYSFLRFDAPTAQRMQLLVGSEDGVRVWHNGRLVFENDVVRPNIQLDDVVPLDLQPGSNDVLVRVHSHTGRGGQYLHYRHLGQVKLTLPEQPDGLSLAQRLQSAGTGSQPVPEEFLKVDWNEFIGKGDAAKGRKLFSAESLGCAKCHAAAPGQAGGGGPSLADAGRRFTVPYLVESVLTPSRVISPVFRSTTLVTKEGQAMSGLVVTETADKLELLLPDTKRVTVAISDIEERKLTDASAMPQGLVKTPEELRDVLKYLLSNPTE